LQNWLTLVLLIPHSYGFRLSASNRVFSANLLHRPRPLARRQRCSEQWNGKRRGVVDSTWTYFMNYRWWFAPLVWAGVYMAIAAFVLAYFLDAV
jgi:hypothetical protein